jgi:hypothetical protein
MARVSFAKGIRTGQLVEAIRVLRQTTGIELQDAKGMGLHVTRKRGVCHRCGDQLSGLEQTECATCQSLNFDW